jgi:hypothetical protein
VGLKGAGVSPNPDDASTAGVSGASDEVVRKSKIFVMTRELALSNHAQRVPGVETPGAFEVFSVQSH